MIVLNSGSNKARIIKVPIDGNGSDIVRGALVTQGVTTGQDFGAFIISGAAGADAVGILLSIHDFSVVGDSIIETGAARVMGEVQMISHGDMIAVEYDQADAVDVASATAGTTTITSSDDETGCWHYVTAGTGVGQLGYIKSYDTDTATYKSALTATLDATSDVIRIVAPGRTLVTLNSTADKLATDAGEGTCRVLVIDNQMKYNGQDWVSLDYTLHHDLQLSGKNAKFRAILVFQDLAVSPID